MNNLILVPAISLGRALLGWVENSFKDGKVNLLEWKQLGATLLRMGVPMVAMLYGLNFRPEAAAGFTVLLDIVITKIYSAAKKKK